MRKDIITKREREKEIVSQMTEVGDYDGQL